MCNRQSLRSNPQVKNALAQTLDEYQPAKILIACDKEPLLIRCLHKEAPVRGARDSIQRQ
jgi:hypothetical protein